MTDWTCSEIPDLTGRVMVVTGATSGIGKETARELAERGAYVVLACRDVDKGRAVRAELAPNTEVRHLDLADLDSVHRFAAELSDWRIDTLINNAGLLSATLQRTAAGHELQFGVNALGHFLLTQLLLRQNNLTDRVVWVASNAHRGDGLDMADLDWRRRRYSPQKAYAASKLAELILAYELQRRFTGSGSHLRSMAAHPGFSSTALFPVEESAVAAVVLRTVMRIPYLAQPAAAGAMPTLFAATVSDLAGGSYVGPGGLRELTGPPRPVGSSARSHDRQLGAQLWRECERLTGLR